MVEEIGVLVTMLTNCKKKKKTKKVLRYIVEISYNIIGGEDIY